MSVEHFSNALVIFEIGRTGGQHFGDIEILSGISAKYKLPEISKLYERTYAYRLFADYRKRPYIKSNFTIQKLNEEIIEIKKIIDIFLRFFLSKGIDIKKLKEYYEKFL